jgi:hypothetical protein
MREVNVCLHGVQLTTWIDGGEKDPYPERLIVGVDASTRIWMRDIYFINLPHKVNVIHVKEGHYRGPV